MALVLDVTVGGASANSYGSLVEANEYFLDRGSNWDDLTDAEKNIRLVHAARILDRLKYVGQPTDTTQYLQWPRKSDIVDAVDMWARTGRLRVLDQWIERNEIPDRIKWAQFEVAVQVFTSKGLVGGAENVMPGGAKIASESLGRWAIKYDTASVLDFVSNEALNFLVPYLDETLHLFRE